MQTLLSSRDIVSSLASNSWIETKKLLISESVLGAPFGRISSLSAKIQCQFHFQMKKKRYLEKVAVSFLTTENSTLLYYFSDLAQRRALLSNKPSKLLSIKEILSFVNWISKYSFWPQITKIFSFWHLINYSYFRFITWKTCANCYLNNFSTISVYFVHEKLQIKRKS